MRIGLFGTGYWGKNLVRNLLNQPEVEELLVCDTNPKALKAIKKAFPGVSVTADENDIFQQNKISGVFVVTPPETHYELAVKALKARKHLYVEKPFVINSAHAGELIDLAATHSLTLMSGHTFLYSPPVRQIKTIIESGELGEIEFISFRRINLGIHQKAVNVIWDLLPHDLSMFLYWLGDISLKQGKCFLKTSVGIHPDVGSVFLEFDNGTMVEGLVSWLSPKKLRETIVVGNRKMLVYNDTEPEEKIKIYDKKVEELEPGNFGEYQLTYRVGDVVAPRVESAEPLNLMVRDFISSVQTGKKPVSDGDFALRVTRIIEDII